MSATIVMKNQILDASLGSSATLIGASIDIGLSTTDPGDDGLSATEPVGGGYSRITVANNDTNFPAATGGIKLNATTIQFGLASASWGTITHFVVYDSGSPKFTGILDDGIGNPNPKTVNIGDELRFLANKLRFVI